MQKIGTGPALILLFFLPLLSTALPAWGASAPASSVQPFLQALRDGDRVRVREELTRAGANATMLAMSQALVEGDQGQVVRHATECAEKAPAAGSLQTGIYCNQIVAHMHLSNGDMPSWADRMMWLRRFMSPTGPAVMGGGFDDVDYDALAEIPAPEIVTTGPMVLDFVPLQQNPVIDVTVNGLPTRALVDTGASFALIVSPNLSRKAKLTRLHAGLDLLPDHRAGGEPSDSLVLANLSVAGASVSNIAAVEMPHFLEDGFELVIGLPLLRRFGSLYMDGRGVGLGESRDGKACGARVEASYSTAFHGRQAFMIPVEAGVGSYNAMLDTGLSDALMLDAAHVRGMDLEAVEMRERVRVSGSGLYSAATGDVEVTGRIAGVERPMVVVVRERPKPLFPAMLGRAAFGDEGVIFDFNAPSFCYAM